MEEQEKNTIRQLVVKAVFANGCYTSVIDFEEVMDARLKYKELDFIFTDPKRIEYAKLCYEKQLKVYARMT